MSLADFKADWAPPGCRRKTDFSIRPGCARMAHLCADFFTLDGLLV